MVVRGHRDYSGFMNHCQYPVTLASKFEFLYGWNKPWDRVRNKNLMNSVKRSLTWTLVQLVP